MLIKLLIVKKCYKKSSFVEYMPINSQVIHKYSRNSKKKLVINKFIHKIAKTMSICKFKKLYYSCYKNIQKFKK